MEGEHIGYETTAKLTRSPARLPARARLTIQGEAQKGPSINDVTH